MGARSSKPTETIITIHSFIPKKHIGKGNFAKVVLIERKSDQTPFALKYSKKTTSRFENKIHHVIEERHVLEDLSHCYIPMLRYSFQDEACLYMVLDFIDGGDLRSHMRHRQWSEREAKLIVAEVACGLSYLHSKMIVHRDIKPENILIDKAGHAYISDFNVAIRQTPGNPIRSMAGTEPYMAPEILNRVGYHASVDWWSLGVVLFELIYGERPFRSRNRRELIKKGVYAFPYRLPAISEACQDAISRFLAFDPTYRMGFGDIGKSTLRTHPFLLEISWLAIERKEQAPIYVPTNAMNTLTPPTATSPTSQFAGLSRQLDNENYDEDIERFIRENMLSNHVIPDGADSNFDNVEEFLYYDYTIHFGRTNQPQGSDESWKNPRHHTGRTEPELPDHINSFHGTTNASMALTNSRRPSVASSYRGRRTSVASTNAMRSSIGSRDHEAIGSNPNAGKHSEQMNSISRLIKSLTGRRKSKYQSSELSPSDTHGNTSQTNGSAAILQSQQQLHGLNQSLQTQQLHQMHQILQSRRSRRVSDSGDMPEFFAKQTPENLSPSNSGGSIPRSLQPFHHDVGREHDSSHEQFRQLHLGMNSKEDIAVLPHLRHASVAHQQAQGSPLSQEFLPPLQQQPSHPVPQSASVVAASMGLSMRRRHSIASPVLLLRRLDTNVVGRTNSLEQNPDGRDWPNASGSGAHVLVNGSGDNNNNNSGSGMNHALGSGASGHLLGLPTAVPRSDKQVMYHVGRLSSNLAPISTNSGNNSSGNSSVNPAMITGVAVSSNAPNKGPSMLEPNIDIVYTDATPRHSASRNSDSHANCKAHQIPATQSS